MNSKIIIITTDPRIRTSIANYFHDKGFLCLAIERDKVIPNQELVITEQRIEHRGEDLWDRTAAAIILDSGYMWPQPTGIPSEQQWARYEHNFDEYLRNERESASFWYSFLEILNDSVPVCINPQEAFTAETFKPWALDLLSEQGIATAPFITGNNREQIAKFLEENPGPVLNLPIAGKASSSWDWQRQIDDKNAPLFLQALSSKEEVRVLAVNGKPIHVHPESSDIEEIIDQIPRIQSALKLHLAELVFRYSNRLVLSDFSAAPDLITLDDKTVNDLLDEINMLIENNAG